MESLSEQPFCRSFSNYAKIRVSRQIDLHGVNNLVHLLVRKLACGSALDFNTLEQRIRRHAVFDLEHYWICWGD